MKNSATKLLFSTAAITLLGIMAFNYGLNQKSPVKGANAAGSAPTYVTSLPTTIDVNDYSESEVRSYYSSLTSLSTTEKQGTNLLKNLKPILYYDTRYFSYDAVWKTGNITDRNWNRSPASNITAGSYNASTGTISNYVYYSSGSGDDPYLHLLYRNDGDTNSMKASSSHSSTYDSINREHVWPQSRGFKDDSGASGPAGTDIHHLLLADGRVNQILHNNYSYGNVTTTTAVGDSTGIETNLRGKGPISSTTDVFEPQDADKGDIARACFYMAARYNNYTGTSGAISDFEPYLIINDDVNTNTVSVSSNDTTPASYASLSTLLEWNREDPVDDYEIHRNNLIARNYQYNRNPFVDFPGWAEYIWGNAQSNYAKPSTDVCTSGVTTNIPVTSVILDKTTASISVGGNTTLNATVSPSNATTKTLTWTTTNNLIASISATTGSSITVNGVANGSATITAKTDDGSYTAACSVSVTGTTPVGGDKVDTIPVAAFGGTTGASYVTTETNGTGSTTGVGYAINNFIPSSGQIRGNQAVVTSNFYIRNTTAYSGYYISKIELNINAGTLTAGTAGYCVASYGNSVISASNTTGTVASDQATSGVTNLTWTIANPLTSAYNYFCINNIRTANSATAGVVKVTWVQSGIAVTLRTNLSISGALTNPSQTEDSQLDISGLTVLANYSDNSSATLSSSQLVLPTLVYGTSTYQITYTEGSTTASGDVNVTVTFVISTTYTASASLLTSSSQLSSGDQLIIASPASYNAALGISSGTYRTSVAITINGTIVTALGDATILTLGGSAGAWTLSSGTDFLYYTGSSNTLQTGTSASSGNTWNIAIGSGTTTITNVAAPTRTIQYNSTTPRFSCYTSTQKAVSIYKVSDGGYNFNYLTDVLKGNFCSCTLDELNLINARYVAMTNSEKNHFNITSIVGNDSQTYTGLEAYNVAMARRSDLQKQSTQVSAFGGLMDDNTFIAIISIISLVGVSAIGSFFYFKRKEA